MAGATAPARGGSGRRTGPPKAVSGARKEIRNLATERKFVSILRADLHQSSDLVTGLELEDAVARLEPALKEMRSAVHRFGGMVYRELGDGIFAIFGAPVADDLHAVMACLAARELLSGMEALGDDKFRVRIGIHSGLLIAGPRRLDYTESYDFEGPALILAERLQAAAEPGQALASGTCRHLAQGYVYFGKEKTFTLKGFAQPVMACPVEGAEEYSKWRIVLSRGTAAFVGREAELSQLHALGAAAGTPGRGVLISGDPGVGKSRLVREALRDLQRQGWQSIGTECSPIVGHAPFSLLRGVLLAALAALGPSETALLRGELPAAQANAAQVVLEGAAADSLPEWARLAPRARGRAIVGVACAILRRLTLRQPAALLIEDAQWADEASEAAIEAIVKLTRQERLIILVTIRTGAAPAWTEHVSDLRLALDPLALEAGWAMLDQLLGPSPALNQLKAKILTHTGALPLFIEEVCRGLVEAGRLAGSPGAYDATGEDADLDVPLTVQGVIASRIDRLPTHEKRLLQVASAIGPKVPKRLLQTVSALEGTAFQALLAALVAAGMLVTSPEAGRADTSFPHEFVRQVAYDAILESDRLNLHRRILAELDAQADDPDLAANRIHHAVRARDWARAAELAVAVARQCFGQSAFADAKRHYELAMSSTDKLPPSPEREAFAIDLRIEARMAYGNLGLVSRWLDLAKEAETRALASGDRLRRVPALAMRAAALNFCGAPGEAIETAEAALREAERSGQAGWLAYAEYGLGQARFVAGQYREAVETLECAYRRFQIEGAAPPVGASAGQAALLSCMMICLSAVALGDDAGAEAAQARADALAGEIRTPPAAIAAGLSHGVLLLSRDEPAASEAILTQALDLARRHEVNLFVPVLANPLGTASLRLGKTGPAREAFETARREAESLGHRSAGLRAELGLALCDAARRGGRQAAVEALRRCEQIARQGGYQPVELEALLALAALADRSTGEAAAALRKAEPLQARMAAAGTARDARRLLAHLSSPPADGGGVVLF